LSRARTDPALPASELAGTLASLPATFTFSLALAAGLTKYAIYQLRDNDVIETLGRGLYRRADAPLGDLGLIAIASRAPLATLCLASALARHGLSDAIPPAPDVALPRGTRPPATNAIAQWHFFDPDTFDVARESLLLDPDTTIGLYSAERSIIDAFRTRGTEGPELGQEALRRWLRRRGAAPAQLLSLAATWPRTVPALRSALEVLG